MAPNDSNIQIVPVVDPGDIIPMKKDTRRPLLSPSDMQRCAIDHYHPHHHEKHSCSCDNCCEGVCDCNHDSFLCCCCLWYCIDKQDTVF